MRLPAILATALAAASLLALHHGERSLVHARDASSLRESVFVFGPIGLAQGQQLHACTTSGSKRKSLYFPEDLLMEIRTEAYAMDGSVRFFGLVRLEDPVRPGCFPIDVSGSASGDPEDLVVVQRVRLPAEATSPADRHDNIWIVQRARDLGGQAPLADALLLPAAHGVSDGDGTHSTPFFSNYRPQFYYRSHDGRSPTHVFGPLNFVSGQHLRICAADASRVPTDKVSLDFTEMKWTVEVYGAQGDQPLLRVESLIDDPVRLGDCFDIDAGQLGVIGGAPPGAILVAVYFELPAGTAVVPIASAELSVPGGPAEASLLLPAVQQIRN